MPKFAYRRGRSDLWRSKPFSSYRATNVGWVRTSMGSDVLRRSFSLLGVDVSCIFSGDPKNDVVILLHDGAFGSDAELAWEGLIPLLSSDFYVLAPDLLGFGHTSKIAFLDRSIHEVNIALVSALTDAVLPHRSFHVVGSSFGGGLLIDVAGRVEKPWRIISGTSIGGVSGFARRDEAFRQLRRYDQTEADALRISEMLVADLTRAPGHVARRHRNGLIPGHWETLSAGQLVSPESRRSAVPRLSPLQTLPSATIPLLFVAGEDDALLEPGWHERLAEAAPRGEAVSTAGKHCPNIDYPEAVAVLIRRFLDGLAR